MKSTIHTTLSKGCRDWIESESRNTGEYQGAVIEKVIEFYRVYNVQITEYLHARTFLKEFVKDELADDHEKAVPFIRRLIDEVIKEQ